MQLIRNPFKKTSYEPIHFQDRGAIENFRRCLLGLICMIGIGCGGTTNFALTRIQGSVSIDGQPVEDGHIQFVPQETGQGPIIDADIYGGRYTAKDVPMGKVSVMFYATGKTGKMISDRGTPYPEVISLIPEKFREGIELEVLGENLNQDFHLTSK